MKTRKHKQWGGSIKPYSNADKRKLLAAGFTPDQIKFLNHIKQTYGIKNLNADGIVYLINENADGQLNPTTYTAFYENKYKDDTYTDNEDDEDDDDDDDDDENINISGGRNKSKTRKRRSRYSTKRETSRRRRKPIKRRNAAHKSRRRRTA